jgi:hypothetical protein
MARFEKISFMRCLLLLLFSCFTACQSSGTNSETVVEHTPPSRDQITDYNPGNDERPLNELIQIDGISPGAIISSPIQVTGKANNSWYFERDFPVFLKDENGNTLSSTPAIALSSSRAPGWVPFKADIIFIAGPGTKANLIFELNNPSDTEGFQRSVSIPVILT